MRSAGICHARFKPRGESHVLLLGRNLELIDHVLGHIPQIEGCVFCSTNWPDSACDSSSSARTMLDKPLHVFERIDHGVAILLGRFWR